MVEEGLLKLVRYPKEEQWEELCLRPVLGGDDLTFTVSAVINDVRRRGDEALIEYNSKFDNADYQILEVPKDEIKAAAQALPNKLKDAIESARRSIELFHGSQKEAPAYVETAPGVRCWRRSIAIERVGLYVPGGSAPLYSSLLMLAVPAKLAGCSEVILCTPPLSNRDGSESKSGRFTVPPALSFCAEITGVNRIFRVGGAQAIAAMAYGTSSVPKVDKIFGPGNQYVTLAKQLISVQGCAIDIPAGPSELLVIADNGAEPAFVAADLLSQAEHGTDSQVMLVTTSEELVQKVREELVGQIAKLPREEIARKSLSVSRAVLLKREADLFAFANLYAPEHLIIALKELDSVEEKVKNAGSVFIGNYSPEAAGDYASGTNHTLPTNGHARAFSGVSLDSFVKKITFQKISEEGLKVLAPVIETLAEAEGLSAHAEAVRVRFR